MDNLSRLVECADAAGMSYGKFMATPEGKDLSRRLYAKSLTQEEPLTKFVKCVICGKVFEAAKHSGAKTCSKECRMFKTHDAMRRKHDIKRALG